MDSTTAGQTNYGDMYQKNRESQAQGFDPEQSAPEPNHDYKEPEDLGRDYYDLLRKVHTERTKISSPTIADLMNTWRILKRSENLTKEHQNKSKSFFAWSNPYETIDQSKKGKKLTKETQTRLYGKPFNDEDTKGNQASKQNLILRKDLVEGRYEIDVMYTVNFHHQDF
jgi:hypothetical protein